MNFYKFYHTLKSSLSDRVINKILKISLQIVEHSIAFILAYSVLTSDTALTIKSTTVRETARIRGRQNHYLV